MMSSIFDANPEELNMGDAEATHQGKKTTSSSPRILEALLNDRVIRVPVMLHWRLARRMATCYSPLVAPE